MMDEREAIFLFSLYEGFGCQKIRRIKDAFGGMKQAYESTSLKDWQMVGLSAKDIGGWFEFRKKIDINEEQEKLIKAGVKYVTLWDDQYPAMLGEIYSPPTVLYFMGDINIVSGNCLGVVGTRKMTSYGHRVVRDLISELVKNNVVIVSGLALGVDALAHKVCLEEGGKTIAVLGGGLNEIYPSVNTGLAKQIVESGGLVLTEFAMEMRPQKFTFPARNRIISGLSRGILVAEAPEKSGALITADFALEQNRLVMSVPGSIYNVSSMGCNQLIKKGAIVINTSQDVLAELNINAMHKYEEENIKYEFNIVEKKIYDCLAKGEAHIDEVVMDTNVELEKVVSAMNILAINGIVQELPGGMWSRK